MKYEKHSNTLEPRNDMILLEVNHVPKLCYMVVSWEACKLEMMIPEGGHVWIHSMSTC